MDFTKPSLSEDEAKARAKLYEAKDPFESIPRALLSSAEIADYARVTGMLHPFNPRQLKSASYEVYIGGEVIWWDENGIKQKINVKKGDQLTLRANSIVFAQVEPIFLLPNYIAIRFNLRISHVHRGVLLGTGPLVDPGFHGKLLIPLHNLTSNDYDINTNDALIWIEFTKTSYGVIPTEDLALQPRQFVGFPPDKRWLTPEDYLRKANGPNAIRSSIPGLIRQAADSAQDAVASAKQSAEAAEKIQSRIRNFGIAAVLGMIVAIAGLGFGLYQIGQQFGAMVQNAQSLITTVQQNVGSDTKAATEKAIQSQVAMDKLTARVDALTTELERLTKQPTSTRPGR